MVRGEGEKCKAKFAACRDSYAIFRLFNCCLPPLSPLLDSLLYLFLCSLLFLCPLLSLLLYPFLSTSTSSLSLPLQPYLTAFYLTFIVAACFHVSATFFHIFLSLSLFSASSSSSFWRCQDKHEEQKHRT